MVQKKYFKNLDATRFVAFLAVFAAHSFFSIKEVNTSNILFQQTSSYGKLGFLGLEYFFVLSSFLITWIILEERKKTKKFNSINFLIRRALRVWPLYFIIIIIAYLGDFILSYYLTYNIESLPNITYFLLFIVNFFTIDNGTEYLFFLVFLWSISIEEQFYLLWAVLIKFLSQHLVLISISLILISLLFRTYYIFIDPSSRILYFHTISALGNFGIGSLLAIAYFKQNILFKTFKEIPKHINILVYLCFFLCIIFYTYIFSTNIAQVFERLIFSCFFAYIIIEQSYNNNSLLKLGKIKYFNYLGKISYGLYCYHGLIITLLIKGLSYISYKENILHIVILYPIIILTVTIIISTLSYKYIESWFLKLKQKFY